MVAVARSVAAARHTEATVSDCGSGAAVFAGSLCGAQAVAQMVCVGAAAYIHDVGCSQLRWLVVSFVVVGIGVCCFKAYAGTDALFAVSSGAACYIGAVGDSLFSQNFATHF